MDAKTAKTRKRRKRRKQENRENGENAKTAKTRKRENGENGQKCSCFLVFNFSFSGFLGFLGFLVFSFSGFLVALAAPFWPGRVFYVLRFISTSILYSCKKKNSTSSAKNIGKSEKCDFCLRCKRESLLLPSVPRSKDRCHG